MKENGNWKVERAKMIADLIQTGIENENGEIRQFDILDYYQIINISPKRLFDTTVDSLFECCSIEEIKSFNSFAIKSINDKKISVESILSIKHMLLVNGEIREVTDEEKLNVINFLISNKIRLTNDVYSTALKKYFAGELDLNINDKKRKSKTRTR